MVMQMFGKAVKLPIVYKNTNGRFGKNSIVQQRFKGRFTRAEILAKVNNLTRTAKKNGVQGEISVAIRYPEGEWRSGYWTRYGAPVLLHEHSDSGDIQEDPAFFNDFAVYYLKEPPKKGGCNTANNDCLYDTLKSVLLDHMPWDSPAEFKKYLGLKRKDMVDIKYLPLIEKKLPTYRINLLGDHIHTSTKPAIMEINITLDNEHYRLDMSKKRKFFGIQYKEQKPVMIIFGKDDIISACDKSGARTITRERFKSIGKDYSNIIIFGDANKKKNKEDTKVMTIKEQFDQFIKDATALKEASNGQLNLFKTGRPSLAALNLFDKFTKAIIPEIIKQDEAVWVKESTMAALITNEKYSGPAHKQDFCSWYPSIMNDKYNLFPIKRGEFKTVTQDYIDTQIKSDKPSFSFGIYRCEIEYDPKHYKEFRINRHNKYTHRDMQTAAKLKMKMKLIIDDEPNFLHYPRSSCVTGQQLFGKFVEEVFKLKKDKVPLSKEVLNDLWGALCERWKIPIIIKIDSTEDEVLEEGSRIVSIHPLDDNRTQTHIVKNQAVYKTDFARIGPFLLAYSRHKAAAFITEHKDNIVRFHTDGFITKTKLNVTYGNDMGDLKYEGYCPNVTVHNNIKVDGKFIL